MADRADAQFLKALADRASWPRTLPKFTGLRRQEGEILLRYPGELHARARA